MFILDVQIHSLKGMTSEFLNGKPINETINESVLAEKYMKGLTESEYNTSYI